MDKFLNLSATTPLLSIDTETNGEDVRDGRGYCQGISLAFRYNASRIAATYLPIRHTFGYNYDFVTKSKLTEVLHFRDSQRLSNTYHNSKFDIVSLGTAGIKLSNNKHYCTMLMSHLLKEKFFFAEDLTSVVKGWTGLEIGKVKSDQLKKLIKAVGWGGVPSEIMYEYALQDAGLPLLAFDAMKPQWDLENLDSYWFDRKCKTIDTVIDMERRGVLIDQKMCKYNIMHGENIMLDIAEMLEANPSSPKDLHKLLVEGMGLPVVKRTDTGRPSFDKDAMEEYEAILERRSDETAHQILEYRGWQKTVSSNYRAYLELLSPDQRLRCNYKLHGTRTGRFSCAKPNLQQIPRSSVKPWNGATKKAFIAPEGYSMWEIDYSQLEFRLGAAYAQEKELLAIFANSNRDVFSEMAAKSGMARHDEKTKLYSIQYGAGVNRIKNVFGISAEAAREIIDTHYRIYPGFKKITKLAENTCKTRGKVKIWSGRYRHFMWPKSEAHKAFNSVCQGGAADIVEESMNRIHEKYDSDDCQLLLQVHDAFGLQIKDSIADQIIPELCREMTEGIPQDFGVRFAVEAKKIGG